MTVFILCVLSEPLCPLWPKRFTSHKGHEEHEEDPPERRSVGRHKEQKEKSEEFLVQLGNFDLQYL